MNFTSVKKSIQNNFHRLVNKLQEFGIKTSDAAIDAGAAAIELIEKNGGELLRQAATAAVLQAAAMKDSSNREKFEFAYNSIKNALESLGKPIVVSAINLAIEMMLAHAKKSGLIK